VHDRHNKHSARLIHIEHRIGKHAVEVAADGRIKQGKLLRLTPDVQEEAFDLVVKPSAQFRVETRVISGRLGIFLVCGRMKGVWLPAHDPANASGDLSAIHGLRFAVFDFCQPAPGFLFPGFFNAWVADAQIFGQASNKFPDLFRRPLAGFFNDLLQRHRHGALNL
jgi:hypothetical protein